MGLFSFCAENGVRGRAGSWLVPLTFNFPERKRYAVKHNNLQEMNKKKNITFRSHTGCRYETAKTKHDACASKGVVCMRHGDRGTVLITLPINMFFCSKARPFCSFRSRFVERRFGPGSLSHFSSGAENLQKKKPCRRLAVCFSQWQRSCGLANFPECIPSAPEIKRFKPGKSNQSTCLRILKLQKGCPSGFPFSRACPLPSANAKPCRFGAEPLKD